MSTPTPVASIIILCCNQAPVTRMCLESLARHTPLPHQLLLVDNGSTDETPSLLEQFARTGHTGLMELAILRNEKNLGFAAGVNQALPRASGEYVVLLNNDTVLTPGWLEGLLGVAQHVPMAGMAGAVSNEVPDPQQIEPGYGTDLKGLNAFALARRQTHARQVIEVERLSGFCVLIPRPLLQSIGMLDEQFGLGFFEDDDLGVRIRQTGYKLLVALDTYIHHWGSQTIRSLGLDAQQLLTENLEKFRSKWGDDLASRYRMPAATIEPVISEPATISLCMIVKNEEANLAACLDSVHDLVQEIVVVDTGSTDQTKAIAERYGAKVVDFPWVDSFAAARNVSLEHATGDYVFWMDGDDRLDEANRAKLRQLFTSLRKSEMLGCSMKCVCLPDPETGITTAVDHIRLFRRHPGMRWKYRIHEQILPSFRQHGGQVRFADIHIHHVGYQDPALRKKKLERDLRLLHMENTENPDDPFTLFNLGSVYLELAQTADAIPFLERSMVRSHPADSIVRKLYALLIQAHKKLGHYHEAMHVCQQGQLHYPLDAELLFQEGILLREFGDLAGAAQSLEKLLSTRESGHFASLEVGLRGYKARHNLAVIYRDMGRLQDAEVQWHAALLEIDYAPARLGLSEIALTTQNDQLFQTQMEALKGHPSCALDMELLQAKAYLAKKQFETAKDALRVTVSRFPGSLTAKILLSHAYLQEGKDWNAARQLLEEILLLDPENVEARRNLEVLNNQHPGS